MHYKFGLFRQIQTYFALEVLGFLAQPNLEKLIAAANLPKGTLGIANMQTYRIATMSPNFEIIAFNGVTGEFVTTDDPTQDDGAQRLKENPPEPELTPEQVEALRQEHEAFLTQLEGLAVQAIAKGYWDEVYDFVNFHAPETEET